MIGQHDKRFALPGDPEWHSMRSNGHVAERDFEDSQRRLPTVKCPNPDCAIDLTVPAGSAGKKYACPACGSTIVYHGGNGMPAGISAPVPNQSSDPSLSRPNAEAAIQQARQEAPTQTVNTIPTVRTGCIGRGNAGKTALFRALSDGPVGDFLPSGLHVEAGDPREVARLIRESEQTQRLLHLAGLPPTLVASQIHYYLYEGTEPRALYQMQEVIGQVLTHTLPDSSAEQQARYDEYLANLVNTQVIWAVVPCPTANPGPRERRRFANDLRITLAYLREALRQRSLEHPVAVALVLSKIDALFSTAQEAQAVLTDLMLQRTLGPLVDLIQTSERVSEAAIIPVSAFGFGKAIVAEGSNPREGLPPDAEDEPFGTEPAWILREGVDPVPFNLDALFLWTLLFGLRGQEEAFGSNHDRQIRRISDHLQNDLDLAKPWILPLK